MIVLHLLVVKILNNFYSARKLNENISYFENTEDWIKSKYLKTFIERIFSQNEQFLRN